MISRPTLLLAAFLLLSAASTPAADRPNIVWLTCEDMSPRLGAHGDAIAATPNLDRFAAASGQNEKNGAFHLYIEPFPVSPGHSIEAESICYGWKPSLRASLSP